jgi:hypothetical protein
LLLVESVVPEPAEFDMSKWMDMQQISVSLYWNFRKKIASDAFHAAMLRRFPNRLRLIEKNPSGGRMRIENVR